MKYKHFLFIILFILLLILGVQNFPVNNINYIQNVLLTGQGQNLFEYEFQDSCESNSIQFYRWSEFRLFPDRQTAFFSYINSTGISINRFMKYSPWSKGTFS